MTDSVYLHVGPPKTGSSYVQDVLIHNKRLLKEHGIVVPLKRRSAQYSAVADLRGGMWATGELTARWDDVVRVFQRNDGIGVLSQEHFAGMTDPASVERAVTSLAPAEVHVVFAVRDWATMMPANYQQAVRARSKLTYAQYVERVRNPDDELWVLQSPEAIFERWAPFLASPSHFHLLTVPRRGQSRDLLWTRFASLVGAQDIEVVLPEGEVNASMGVPQIEVLRRVNATLGSRLPLPEPYIQAVSRRMLRHGLRVGEQGARLGVKEADLPWLRERADLLIGQVQRLQERGVDVVGDLEDLEADPPAYRGSPEDVGTEELLEITLETLARVMDHHHQERTTLRERRKTERERADRAAEALAAYARTPRGRVRRAAKSLLGRV